MNQLKTGNQQYHHVGAHEIRPSHHTATLPFEILDRKIKLSIYKGLTWGDIHALLSTHVREGLRCLLVTTKGESHLVLEMDKNTSPDEAGKLKHEVYELLVKAIGRKDRTDDVKPHHHRNLTVFGYHHQDDANRLLNAYRFFHEPAEPVRICENGMMAFYSGEGPVLVSSKNVNYIRQDPRAYETVVISFMSSAVFMTYPSAEIAEQVVLKAQEFLMGASTVNS